MTQCEFLLSKFRELGSILESISAPEWDFRLKELWSTMVNSCFMLAQVFSS